MWNLTDDDSQVISKAHIAFGKVNKKETFDLLFYTLLFLFFKFETDKTIL